MREDGIGVINNIPFNEASSDLIEHSTVAADAATLTPPAMNINTSQQLPSAIANNVCSDDAIRRLPILCKYISCRNVLLLIFMITNISIIPAVIFLRIYQFSFIRPPQLVIQDSSAHCIARMVYWLQTLFNIVIIMKLMSLFVLAIQFLKSRIPNQRICFACFMSSSFCLEWLLPFGYGFKLFWHLCGAVMLLDVTSCLPDAYWSDYVNSQSMTTTTTINIERQQQLVAAAGSGGGLFFSEQQYDPFYFYQLVVVIWWAALAIYLTTLIFLIAAIPLCNINRLPRPLPLPPRFRVSLFMNLGNENNVGASRSERTRRSDEFIQDRTTIVVPVNIRQTGQHHTTLQPISPRHLSHHDRTAAHTQEEQHNYQGINAFVENARRSRSAIQLSNNLSFASGPTSQSAVSATERGQRTNTQRGLRRRDIEQLFQFQYSELQAADRNTAPTSQEGDDSSNSPPPIVTKTTTHGLPPEHGRSTTNSPPPPLPVHITNPTASEQNTQESPNTISSTNTIRPNATHNSETNIAATQEREESNDSRSVQSAAAAADSGQQEAGGGSLSSSLARRILRNERRRHNRVNGIINSTPNGPVIIWSGQQSQIIASSSVENAYVLAYPILFHILLIIVYYIVIFTDITAPPECCREYVGAGKMDDMLNVAIYRIIRLWYIFSNIINNAMRKFRRFCPKCFSICCKGQIEKDLKLDKEKEIRQAQKNKRIKSMFSEVFITDGSCCICCMEYVPDDRLILLPCPSRHYFHKNCAIAWLNKHDSCPLCRYSLTEAFNDLGINSVSSF